MRHTGEEPNRGRRRTSGGATLYREEAQRGRRNATGKEPAMKECTPGEEDPPGEGERWQRAGWGRGGCELVRERMGVKNNMHEGNCQNGSLRA